MTTNNDGTQPIPSPDTQPTQVLAGQPEEGAAAAAAGQPGAGTPTDGYTPAGSYQPAGAYQPSGAWSQPAGTTPPSATYGAPAGSTGTPGTGYGTPAGSYGTPGSGYGAPGAYPPPTGPYAAPTGAYAPPAQPRWSGQRLTRSRSERMLGGVCGGLARYWNTDPVLLRIVTVVLTVFTGGAFALAYLLAWIAIPDEPMGPTAPFGQATDAEQVGYASGGTPPYAGAPMTAQPAPAPRERSYLGWLVVSAAVLAAGILGLIGFLVPASVAMWGIIGGVTLAILGLGLLVGTRYGRARWLVIPAIPLAFITFGAVTAGNWIEQNPNWGRWTDGSSATGGEWGGMSFGDRTWEVLPVDVAESPLEFRLTAGEATLDLTELTALGDAESARPRQRVEIDAGVGLGGLRVIIPADMVLDLDATVEVGEIDVPGSDAMSGSDLDLETTVNPIAETNPAYIVTLDAAIGAGNLEVLREAA